MRYRPPSKRGRPSFIPTPTAHCSPRSVVSFPQQAPPFSPTPFKNRAEETPISKAQTRRSKVQTPSAALTLVRKKVSPHDKKYFISRAQTFILVSANSANTSGALFGQAKCLIIKRKRSKSPNFRIAKRTRRVRRYSTDRHIPIERAPHLFPKKLHQPQPLPLF